jgi:hypothetical protein
MNNGKHFIIAIKNNEAMINYFGVLLTHSSLSGTVSHSFVKHKDC